MSDFSELRLAACKGELDWMCKCLTSEQLAWVLKNFKDLTPEQVDDRYTLICCEIKRKNGGVVAQEGACSKDLLDTLCSPEGRARLRMARLAVDALRAVPGLDDLPITRRVLAFCSLAIDAAEAACEQRKMVNSGARLLCEASNGVKKLNQEGGAVAVFAKPLTAFFEMPAVASAISKCCSDPAVRNAALPEWLVVP